MATKHRKRIPVLDVRRYRGQYVMLHPKTDEIVGHGRTIDAARKAALKRGVRNPVLYPVPKSDAYFVGGSRF